MKANLNMESETKTYDLFIFYLVSFLLTSFYFPYILKKPKKTVRPLQKAGHITTITEYHLEPATVITLLKIKHFLDSQ